MWYVFLFDFINFSNFFFLNCALSCFFEFVLRSFEFDNRLLVSILILHYMLKFVRVRVRAGTVKA